MPSGIFFVSRTRCAFSEPVPIDVVVHGCLWLSDWAVFYCQLDMASEKTPISVGGIHLKLVDLPLRLTVGLMLEEWHKTGVLPK